MKKLKRRRNQKEKQRKKTEETPDASHIIVPMIVNVAACISSTVLYIGDVSNICNINMYVY